MRASVCKQFVYSFVQTVQSEFIHGEDFSYHVDGPGSPGVIPAGFLDGVEPDHLMVEAAELLQPVYAGLVVPGVPVDVTASCGKLIRRHGSVSYDYHLVVGAEVPEHPVRLDPSSVYDVWIRIKIIVDAVVEIIS